MLHIATQAEKETYSVFTYNQDDNILYLQKDITGCEQRNFLALNIIADAIHVQQTVCANLHCIVKCISKYIYIFFINVNRCLSNMYGLELKC